MFNQRMERAMKGMWKLFAGLVVMLAAAQGAKAQTQSEQFCDAVGDLAYMAAVQRDKGVDRGELYSAAVNRVKAPETRAFINSVISTVYSNPGIPPKRAAKLAIAACLNANASKGAM